MKTIQKGDIVIGHHGIFQVSSTDLENDLISISILKPSDALHNRVVKSNQFFSTTESLNVNHFQLLCTENDFYNKYKGSFIHLFTAKMQEFSKTVLDSIHEKA